MASPSICAAPSCDQKVFLDLGEDFAGLPLAHDSENDERGESNVEPKSSNLRSPCESDLSQAGTPLCDETPPTSAESRGRVSFGESALRDYFGTFSNLRSLTPPKQLRRSGTRKVELKCSAREADEHAHFRQPGRDLALLQPDVLERPPIKLPTTMTLAVQLKKLHGRRKRLPAISVNAIIYQLTRAVAHAAGLGVCHRQVRPENITLQIPPLLVQLAGWDDEPSPSSRPYSAPEVFLSPESVIMEHMKADVWSVGMVLIEALRGTPLVKTDPKYPIEPYMAVGQIMRSLGTPSDAALEVLDPTLGCHAAMWDVIQPKPWRDLLKGIPVDGKLSQLLDRMLDWNPATREPAVSLLCCPFFGVSRATSSTYRSAERFARC
jgi:hypothetical protein